MSEEGRIAAALQCPLHEMAEIDTQDKIVTVSLYLLDWDNKERQTIIKAIDPASNRIYDTKIGTVSAHQMYGDNMQDAGCPALAGIMFDY